MNVSDIGWLLYWAAHVVVLFLLYKEIRKFRKKREGETVIQHCASYTYNLTHKSASVHFSGFRGAGCKCD